MVDIPEEKKRKTKQLKNNEQPKTEEKIIKAILVCKTNFGNIKMEVKGAWDEDELTGFVDTMSAKIKPNLPNFILQLKQEAMKKASEPEPVPEPTKEQVEEQVKQDLEKQVESKTE